MIRQADADQYIAPGRRWAGTRRDARRAMGGAVLDGTPVAMPARSGHPTRGVGPGPGIHVAPDAGSDPHMDGGTTHDEPLPIPRIGQPHSDQRLHPYDEGTTSCPPPLSSY